MAEDVVEGGFVSAATPKSATRNLAQLYREALEANLADSSGATVRRACEIGRRAIAEGLSLFELAAMHHEALARTLSRTPSSVRSAQEIRRAGEFLCESLSPYEIAHRGFRQNICALRQLNEALEREIRRDEQRNESELAAAEAALAEAAKLERLRAEPPPTHMAGTGDMPRAGPAGIAIVNFDLINH